MYIISGCLLGENCKYSGGNNFSKEVQDFAEKNSHIAVCPEVEAGMTIPRVPMEIAGDKVISMNGEDLTEVLKKGCLNTWNRIVAVAEEKSETFEGAILKAKSPSCGCGIIYDGSFTHSEIEGDGLFAGFLKDKNIPVVTENDIYRLEKSKKEEI